MPKDYLISAPHNQHKRGLKMMDTVKKMNLETPVPPGRYLESVVVDHATSSESVNNCHSEYVERASDCVYNSPIGIILAAENTVPAPALANALKERFHHSTRARANSDTESFDVELWSLPDSFDIRTWSLPDSFDIGTWSMQHTFPSEDTSILARSIVLFFILGGIFVLRHFNNIEANVKKLDMFETTFEWNRKCMNFRIVASLESCESHLDDIHTWYE